MANEYLQRTPTSTGNRKVWTWSGWIKLNSLSTSFTSVMEAFTGSSDVYCTIALNSNSIVLTQDNGAGGVMTITASPLHRDPSSWFHLLVSVDTTQTLAQNRVRIYVNGDEEVVTYTTTPSINFETHFNRTGGHRIGTRWNLSGYINAEYTDVFFIDGQALTPDVFGFYKVGKGYISAGSTQATDFRPGQWVPKTPRAIKTAINNNGGFGVNGFYLPMNDSKNFGADFHCDPNSIITLNEKLPQPRVGVATTATAGIGFTDALRSDPYAANLVLAVPGVVGGQGSGYGDYSANIKGSGSNKTLTANGNAGVAVTASYYGSALSFDGSGDYFTSANSSDFYFNGDFTVEFWVYRNVTSTSETLVGVFENSVARRSWQIETRTNSALRFEWFSDGSSSSNITTANNSVPGSQWNHIAMVKKNNTITGYVNGVAAGINTTAGAIYQNTVDPLRIGVLNAAEDQDFNGYLQDLRIYKGVAKYTGGFDVPRPYTPVGIATWRAVPDTTANNFATWNPAYPVIAGSNAAYTNGNLTIAEPTGNNSQGTATIGVSTGKWYYEAFPSNVTTGSHLIGIRPAEWFTDNAQNRTAYRSDGSVYNDSATTVQSGTTYTSSDIIGVAFDMNTKQLWFSKNGSWVYSGNPSGGSNQAVSFASTYSHYTPMFAFDNVAGTQTFHTNFGQNPTFSGNTTAGTFTDSNGKGLFKYQPPSGFLALCEDNLPTPAIANPGRHFRTVLYTGDGNSGRSIVGVGFTSDLVWIKCRNTARVHGLWDSVRGASNYLVSSSTAVETSDTTNGLQSFNSDGFSIGSVGTFNTSTDTYVAWCWKAGAGTTSTNTNGSITSVVSVNQDAGFSIVSYTGTAASATVGHGLGKAPGLIILKNRDDGTRNWPVYHKSFSIADFIYLNLTNAKSTDNSTWGTTNSSIFTLGNGVTPNTSWNANGQRYIAYCWAEIEGFSKFGSYVANGSTDGPFVYCGFKPALVITKRTDSTGGWQILDSSRMSINSSNTPVLFPNTSGIELGTDVMDFLSNGFKFRSTGTDYNASGGTYIFAAYAESPFQTANSK